MSGQRVKIPTSRLFGDLAIYLVEVFEMGRMSEYRPYKYVEAFCKHNNLDTGRIRQLLQEYGAYNDSEVLLNCLRDIPPYRELPQETPSLQNSGSNKAEVVQEG